MRRYVDVAMLRARERCSLSLSLSFTHTHTTLVCSSLLLLSSKKKMPRNCVNENDIFFSSSYSSRMQG